MQMKGPFDFIWIPRWTERTEEGAETKKKIKKNKKEEKKKYNLRILRFCLTYGSMFACTMVGGLALVYTYGVPLFNKKNKTN